VGAGSVGVPADMDQLLRIKAAQVGQQVHLAGKRNLIFWQVGHGKSPPGIRKAVCISANGF